jgi:transcription initiation factor IIE alpha subunit
MINQKEKVLNVLSEGREVTAKQLSSQFGIGSPTKVISELRRDGHAIYLNRRVDTKGRETQKYRLGTPTRRMVAVAASVLGASAFGA